MKSMKIKNLSLTLVFMTMVNIVSANDNSNTDMGFSDTTIFSLLVATAIILLVVISAQVSTLSALLENKDVRKNKKSNDSTAKKAMSIIAVFLLSQSIYAQGADSEPMIRMSSDMYWMLLSLNALLLGVVVFLQFTTKGIIKSHRGVEAVEAVGIQLPSSVTGVLPIEQEKDLLLDHDYDGIKELDNNLPPWWKYGFYLTIIVGFIYIGYYHFGGGDLQIAEYEKDMAEGEAIKAAFKANEVDLVDESNLTLVTDAAGLEDGLKTYTMLCKVCHGEFGEGLVGPNFTDKYWKHGGSLQDIYNTIKIGVPEKGMISWESTLSAAQRLNVSSYILSFQGTNPENQKAAEGDLYEGDSAEPQPESTEEPVTDATEIVDEDA